jgi:hypothetical protein
MTDCFGREILARRKAAGRKGPEAYLNNTVRTFLTENAAVGQKGRPKQNSCEISGLAPHFFRFKPSAFLAHDKSLSLVST